MSIFLGESFQSQCLHFTRQHRSKFSYFLRLVSKLFIQSVSKNHLIAVSILEESVMITPGLWGLRVNSDAAFGQSEANLSPMSR